MDSVTEKQLDSDLVALEAQLIQLREPIVKLKDQLEELISKLGPDIKKLEDRISKIREEKQFLTIVKAFIHQLEKHGKASVISGTKIADSLSRIFQLHQLPLTPVEELLEIFRTTLKKQLSWKNIYIKIKWEKDYDESITPDIVRCFFNNVPITSGLSETLIELGIEQPNSDDFGSTYTLKMEYFRTVYYLQ